MAFPLWLVGVVLVCIGKVADNFGNNLVSLSHKETKQIEKEKSSKSRRKRNRSNSGTSSSSTVNSQDYSGDLDSPCGFGRDPEDIENHSSSLTIETDLEPEEETETVQYMFMGCCSWRVLGIWIFAIGNLFTFASFGLGAQSLLSALGSVQFISNIFFVKYVHALKITTRMCLATTLIILGNILVVIFSEHNAVLFTSGDMMRLYRENHIYQGYLAFVFLLWSSTTYTWGYYYKSRMIDRILLYEHTFIEPFCYAVSSAVVGTQAVLQSKCLALLITGTIDGQKNEFDYFFVYILLGVWLILVSYWLKRLDGGLKMYPPPFIIPVMQVFFVFFAIMCGGLFFEEFLQFSTSQFIGFSFGVAMILSGVYGLAPTDVQLDVGELPETDQDADQGVQMAQCVGDGVLDRKSQYVKCDDVVDEEALFDGSLKMKPSPREDANVGSTTVVPVNAEVKDCEHD